MSKNKLYDTEDDALEIAQGLWKAGYIVDIVQRGKKYEVITPKAAYCADGIPLRVGNVVCMNGIEVIVTKIIDYLRYAKAVAGPRFHVVCYDANDDYYVILTKKNGFSHHYSIAEEDCTLLEVGDIVTVTNKNDDWYYISGIVIQYDSDVTDLTNYSFNYNNTALPKKGENK